MSHALFETAAGYALFSVSLQEEIGQKTKSVQESISDYGKFSRIVKLASFYPFKDAAHALENANDISEGIMNEHLQSMLDLAFASNKKSVVLSVEDRALAGAIKSGVGIECDSSERALEVIRGIRTHIEKLLPDLQDGDVERAQLGLGHAYSRAKVKFNVNRSDNMIIQAIALLDQMDKDVNTFAMRVREWYGWHFPELYRLVPDNNQYAKVVQLLGDKSKLTDDILPTLSELLDDNEILAKNVLDASRSSMGTDISPIDLINISNFASRVIHLFAYRKSLQIYLSEKMGLVAPNLASLIGDTVGARLISHAGSLTNLSKYPASTVQILGAEKALFRALKTKGNTPKYGLIYHSTFIGRAGQKNKGRISRFLANKCSIASRIDCYADTPTTKFGEALRGQVEERLEFYEKGSNPSRNSAVMAKVMAGLAAEGEVIGVQDESIVHGGEVELSKKDKKKKDKKRKSDVMEVDQSIVTESGELVKKDKKKKRKSDADTTMDIDTSISKKKHKKSKEVAADAAAAPIIGDATPATSPVKEKKSKKDKKANA
ncbi:uncharacterized protein L969DRAFT_72697 [Mixia osmundae IAM 14324]|uniref:Nucleolar protein 56 n=1 Tax=Mixia osmundae (strain CBS 9802 / IAM 14324 / JCM 22182 / KY 12970) TaxID=764103 RepID=G7DU93_MIXOS|nr:uncharacterized protein L969DRAFT_72697 [Mixia osmundae IAM 14324]KEI41024.1 hypothetical protein L969DRAFT_72697 [Mixia osmundae IAM 14324]GAA94153.1 hypothetical protein E5Q_00801 [Mixia osmundae IAM 14324]